MNQKQKLKFQPSIYVARMEGESSADFTKRILRDPRLLADQRVSLEQDKGGPFEDLVKGIWLEQPPLQAGN